MPQQLFAKIKRSSKYYNQNECAKEAPQQWGWPFRVTIVADEPSAYKVKGGPGGQYRLEDVNLYVVEDGCELRIA